MFRQYGEVPEQDNAALELHGFHAQLHDRVQGALRRVDRQAADLLYFVYSIANIFNLRGFGRATRVGATRTRLFMLA